MKLKYELEILGYEYEIEFHEKKVFIKKIGEDKGGQIDYKELKIDIMLVRWEDDRDLIVTEIGKILWHEVGHAIGRSLPTSIVESEWFAVCGEEFFKLRLKLDWILDDVIKTVVNK